MESGWKQQITDIEKRARTVNLALNQLCVAAGVRQNNLTRWKQGCSPSLRVFLRDLTKLESKLSSLEFDMAMTLIGRINPTAAPRIAELLQAPGARGQVGTPPDGCPADHKNSPGSDAPLAPSQVRDGRRDGNEAGNTGQARSPAGDDRAA